MNYSRLPIDIEYCGIGYTDVWKGKELTDWQLKSLMKVYMRIELFGNGHYNDEHFLGIL